MKAFLTKIAVVAITGSVLVGCGNTSTSNNSISASESEYGLETVPKNSEVEFQAVDFNLFADQNLAACVKESGVLLTNAQTLVCPDQYISSLSGIEQFTDLRVLDVSHNQLSDTRPLATLSQLYSLDLSYNQLAELHDIERLTKLYKLNVNHNQLVDLINIQELRNLKRLYVRDNQLQSLAFVGELSGLENLDAENNQSNLLPRLPSSIKTFRI